MEWGTIAVGLGALAIAAFSLWLTHRERVATLRSALYAKQVDSFGAIASALTELHVATMVFLDRQTFPLEADARESLRTQQSDQRRRLGELILGDLIYLPTAVSDDIQEFQLAYDSLVAPAERAILYPAALVHHPDPRDLLTTAHNRVVMAMRQQLGTQALSEQTLRLLAQPRSEEPRRE